MKFEDLNKKFENTNNLASFWEEEQHAFRFLLVRSLKKENLKDILNQENISFDSNTYKELYPTLWNSNLSVECLVKYVKKFQSKERELRNDEVEGLSNALQEFEDIKCGIRNDRLNSLAGNVVRDKSIKSRFELNKRIEEEVFPKVRQYLNWSWFNQNANDLIEQFFIEHEKVLPTLRKIPDVDFFILVDGNYLPFDLKITHISRKYYGKRRESRGLETEEAAIKSIFKESKDHHIYNRSFEEMINFIKDTPKGDFRSKGLKTISSLCEARKEEIASLKENLTPLHKWNYTNQGERLFNNNYRFFIYLADPASLKDSRYLKSKIPEIKNKLTPFLDNFSKDKLSRLSYTYTQAEYRGDYSVYATGLLYCTE